MPMFPDSGVPAPEARNTIDVNTPAGCDELWYSTARCQPRFDPAAANAMLAEDMNLVMSGALSYDCTSLTNIERAVRYINQRGLPRAAYMLGGPNTYTAVLDPPATHHNNFMTLTVVPQVTNIGPVTLNIGFGNVPILRNDTRNLENADLRAGMPYIIAYINGYWYMCSLAASQVPLLVKGGIDCWIRTDGNDITGDGTVNTPEKAFRTIQGCWNAVGSRYAATPLFSINMRFGIPGTYIGTIIGPFGGNVTLSGDRNNPTAYRITSVDVSGIGTEWCAFGSAGISQMTVYGVTFLLDHAPPGNCFATRVGSGNCSFVDCVWEALVSNTSGGFLHINTGSCGTADCNWTFNGNGHSIAHILWGGEGANFFGARYGTRYTNMIFNSINCTASCVMLHTISMASWNAGIITANGVTGPQYSISGNSVYALGGQVLGSTPGSFSSGAQVIP